ncbi:MAG: Rdx family protein [Anaerolineae bacterium]|nr:Rdx family protein [Anaerolineae bacterium]
MSEIMWDKELEFKITSLDIIPSSGGVFEVTVDDELIFSKKALKRHAEPHEIYNLIKAKLK